MNERIKELANQSYIKDEYGVPLFDHQMFAELIVKKCAYLVNDQQRTTGYTTHAQMLCGEFGIEYKDEDYYGAEPHTCPYKIELYDDHDTLCTCDSDQEYQCAMDV